MTGMVPHASRRHGNKRPSRWTSAHDAKVRRLWKAGKTDREIAPLVGFSHSSVVLHRVALGLTRPRSKSEARAS